MEQKHFFENKITSFCFLIYTLLDLILKFTLKQVFTLKPNLNSRYLVFCVSLLFYVDMPMWRMT